MKTASMKKVIADCILGIPAAICLSSGLLSDNKNTTIYRIIQMPLILYE